MRILDKLLQTFRLTRGLSGATTTFRYTPTEVNANILTPNNSRSYGSQSGNSNNFTPQSGESSERPSKRDGKKNISKHNSTFHDLSKILPIALISSGPSNSSSAKIMLIPINLFEGGDEAVQKTLATLSILRDHAAQIATFSENLPNVSCNTYAHAPLSLSEFDAQNDTAFASSKAAGEKPRPSDSFDVVSWNDSKRSLLTNVPETLQEKLKHMAIHSMQLAFEMDMTNIRDALLMGHKATDLDASELREPRSLKDPTLSLSTSLFMDSAQQQDIVPLNFNALIQGIVEIDPSKLTAEQLNQLRVPEFNDCITTIAANLCSTALRKGFPADIGRKCFSTQSGTTGKEARPRNPHIVCVRNGEKGCISPGNADNPMFVPKGSNGLAEAKAKAPETSALKATDCNAKAAIASEDALCKPCAPAKVEQRSQPAMEAKKKKYKKDDPCDSAPDPCKDPCKKKDGKKNKNKKKKKKSKKKKGKKNKKNKKCNPPEKKPSSSPACNTADPCRTPPKEKKKKKPKVKCSKKGSPPKFKPSNKEMCGSIADNNSHSKASSAEASGTKKSGVKKSKSDSSSGKRKKSRSKDDKPKKSKSDSFCDKQSKKSPSKDKKSKKSRTSLKDCKPTSNQSNCDTESGEKKKKKRKKSDSKECKPKKATSSDFQLLSCKQKKSKSKSEHSKSEKDDCKPQKKSKSKKRSRSMDCKEEKKSSPQKTSSKKRSKSADSQPKKSKSDSSVCRSKSKDSKSKSKSAKDSKPKKSKSDSAISKSKTKSKSAKDSKPKKSKSASSVCVSKPKDAKSQPKGAKDSKPKKSKSDSAIGKSAKPKSAKASKPKKSKSDSAIGKSKTKSKSAKDSKPKKSKSDSSVCVSKPKDAKSQPKGAKDSKPKKSKSDSAIGKSAKPKSAKASKPKKSKSASSVCVSKPKDAKSQPKGAKDSKPKKSKSDSAIGKSAKPKSAKASKPKKSKSDSAVVKSKTKSKSAKDSKPKKSKSDSSVCVSKTKDAKSQPKSPKDSKPKKSKSDSAISKPKSKVESKAKSAKVSKKEKSKSGSTGDKLKTKSKSAKDSKPKQSKSNSSVCGSKTESKTATASKPKKAKSDSTINKSKKKPDNAKKSKSASSVCASKTKDAKPQPKSAKNSKPKKSKSDSAISKPKTKVESKAKSAKDSKPEKSKSTSSVCVSKTKDEKSKPKTTSTAKDKSPKKKKGSSSKDANKSESRTCQPKKNTKACSNKKDQNKEKKGQDKEKKGQDKEKKGQDKDKKDQDKDKKVSKNDKQDKQNDPTIDCPTPGMKQKNILSTKPNCPKKDRTKSKTSKEDQKGNTAAKEKKEAESKGCETSKETTKSSKGGKGNKPGSKSFSTSSLLSGPYDLPVKREYCTMFQVILPPITQRCNAMSFNIMRMFGSQKKKDGKDKDCKRKKRKKKENFCDHNKLNFCKPKKKICIRPDPRSKTDPEHIMCVKEKRWNRKDIPRRNKLKNCYDGDEECPKIYCKEPLKTACCKYATRHGKHKKGKKGKKSKKGKKGHNKKENEHTLGNYFGFNCGLKSNSIYVLPKRMFNCSASQICMRSERYCDDEPRRNKQQCNEVIKINKPGKIEKNQENLPIIGDYDVMIRTEAVALSGSDVHIYETGSKCSSGVTLGHDATGLVETIGRCVYTLKRGDRVVVESGLSCGICDFCKRGLYNMCGQLIFNGFLSKYQVHPADLCHKIPSTVSLEEATLTQTLALGCQSCIKAQITPITNVLVIGSGPTAVAAALSAKAFGADKVCVTSTGHYTLESIKRTFDLEYVLHDECTQHRDALEGIYSTFCNWPDVVINCAISENTMNLAVMALQVCGICVLAECEAECACFNAMDVLMKNIRLVPSFRSTNMFPTAIHLIQSGQAPMYSFIKNSFNWSHLDQAFRAALHESNIGYKKVIVQCADEENCEEEEFL